MSSATLTTMDAIAKQLYRQTNYNELVYKMRPMLGLLTKFEGFGGKSMPIPIKYANPSGVSNTFASAQSNRAPSRFSAFNLTRKKVYATATIDGETADTLEEDTETFVVAMKNELDGALRAASDMIEGQLFRSATGSLGTVGSVSGASLTLASIYDVTNFEVGLTLIVSATDGGSQRTGSEVIAGVNRGTGVITSADSGWTTGISAIQAGDYIYIDGNRNAAINGLESWIPETAPTTGDAYFGVDRSVDTRLMGLRYDASATGATVEEALIQGESLVGREGGMANYAILNTFDFTRLLMAIGSKVQYPRESVSAKSGDGMVPTISFSAIVLQGHYSTIKVIPAPKCPQGVAWVGDFDAWSLNSKGPVPKILRRDGLSWLRQANADGYECRVGGYGNLATNAPGHVCRVKLPA